MIKVSTRLKGDFANALKEAERNISERVLVAGAAAMAKVIYDDIQNNPSFPEKSGLLKSAIYRTLSKDNSTENKAVYHVGVNKRKAPHWHWLEFGNSRIPAQPYIRPAFDKIGEAIEAGKARMAERLKTL